MSNNNRNGTFALISQQGPFATRDTPPPLSLSFANRDFVRILRENRLLTRYRIVRNQIFDFLNIRSFAEIEGLQRSQTKQAAISKRAYALLGNMFGLKGSEQEIVAAIGNYSRTADGVIRYLRGKVLAPYASYIEITNEVDISTNPVDLLLMIFDDRYHKKARFEAKRKLLLMNLAGSIEQRERETEVEKNFASFLSFLNERVWSPNMLIGELDVSFLCSQHDPDDFSCREVEVVPITERTRSQGNGNGQKMTMIKRRRFNVAGREIPIYVSIRKKPPEAKVLKLLRKGEENPSIAVDDELGLMAVLDSISDVRLFQEHLTKCAIRADSFMTLEDVSDTLTGGRHPGRNIGSSEKTSMFKFFAKMGGMRVEFIIHTNKTYLNYIYQRGVSHDEYEIKRIFDTGVAELLFPQDIYHLDMTQVKERRIELCRNNIEKS